MAREFTKEGWDIRREPRLWTREEVNKRLYQAPEKIEFAGGIFNSDDERMIVLAMLLENLGMDRVLTLGSPEDWKVAVAALERGEP